MSNAKRHLRNTAALVGAGAVARFIFLGVSLIIFKRFTVDDNGMFQFAYDMAGMFALATELGVHGLLVRQLARLRDDTARSQELFGDVLNLRLLLYATAIPVSILVMLALGYPWRTVAATQWLFLFAVLDSLAKIAKSVVRAHERMEYDAAFSLLGRGTILLLVWFFASRGLLGVGTATAAHVAGSAMEVAGLAIFILYAFGLRPFARSTVSRLRVLLSDCLPFAVLAIVGVLYLRSGTLILSLMRGDEAVSYYKSAGRFVEAAMFIPVAVVNALIPFLCRHHGDLCLVRRYHGFLMKYLGFAAIGLCMPFLLEPDWIICVLTKPEYLAARRVFQLYGLWILLAFLQHAMANMLICLNEERIVMWRYVTSLGVNVVLNVVLIWQWSYEGAALALVLSELYATLFNVAILRRRQVEVPWSVPLQVAALGLLMAAVLYAGSGLAPIMRLSASVLAGMAFVACSVWMQDRELVLSLVRKRPDA